MGYALLDYRGSKLTSLKGKRLVVGTQEGPLLIYDIVPRADDRMFIISIPGLQLMLYAFSPKSISC